MASANRVLAEIGAMKSLIENFPMSILDDMGSQGETYDSVFKFMIDLLYSCGIDTNRIFSEILTQLYSFEYDFETEIIEGNLDKATKTKNTKLEGIETVLKTLLNSFFAGLFSCSITPYIPNKYFDSSVLKGGSEQNPYHLMSNTLKNTIDNRYFDKDLIVPLKFIDLFDILKINPISKDGLKYYDVGAKYVYYKKEEISQNPGAYKYTEISEDEIAEKDKKNAKIVSIIPQDGLANSLSPTYLCKYVGTLPNNLYMTKDMNAFIWYVMNFSFSSYGESYNRMMWTNRNELESINKTYLETSEDDRIKVLDVWYKTKKTSVYDSSDPLYTANVVYPDGEFSTENVALSETVRNQDYYPEGTWETSPYFKSSSILEGLKPILQLEPLKGYDEIDKSNALIFHIPSQEYFAPSKREKIKDGINPSGRLYFNGTMWKFNKDYLDSIQILNPRFLLVRTIENLYNFILGRASTIDVSLNKRLIENKIRQVISNFVITEDGKIEDCFFEFSNEDFDEAIRTSENERRSIYTDKDAATEKSENIADLLNPVLNGEQAGTETAFGILSSKIISNRTGSNSYGERTKLEVSMNTDLLLEDLVMAIIMPFVESIFTPQVMLYVMVNMKVLGLIDEDSLEDVNNAFDNPVIRFIIVKQLSIIKSLINFVTDLILQIMLNLAIKTLRATVYTWVEITTLEKITDWLTLLTSAYKCLPTFKLKAKTIKDGPDDIVYADIIDNGEELDQPEINNDCKK